MGHCRGLILQLQYLINYDLMLVCKILIIRFFFNYFKWH